MLSKLFLHINLSSKLWLLVGCFIVIGTNYYFGNIYLNKTLGLIWIHYSISGILLLAIIYSAIPLFNQGYKIASKNTLIGVSILLLWSSIPQVFTIELSISLFLFIRFLNGLFLVSEQTHKNSIPFLINVTIISFITFLISPLGWVFLILILINNLLYANISVREILVPIYIFLFALGVTYGISFLIGNTSFLLELWNRNLPQKFSLDIFTSFKNAYIVLISAFAVSLLGLFK